VFFTRELKRRYPDLPLTLFGHSMGSMVVRCYLEKHDDEIDKLIVSGSPSQNPLAGVAVAMAKTISLFKGERHRSSLLAKLSTGNGDKNFPGEGKNAWLTRDRSIVDAYNNDPRCNYTFTCNGFLNLFKLMQQTYDKKAYEVKNKTLPIFFVAGSDDPVIVQADKWQKAQQFLRDVGYENVSGRLYHQMRHELLNEIGKEEIYADLLAFISDTNS
jgi:alpha-beta hydrolase superfamily lysophospholipase